MIDEFIEFILVPIIPLLVYMFLICLNLYTLEKTENFNLKITMCVLWTVSCLLIYPSLVVIQIYVTNTISLVAIDLVLLFSQLLLNIDSLLVLWGKRNSKKKKEYW